MQKKTTQINIIVVPKIAKKNSKLPTKLKFGIPFYSILLFFNFILFYSIIFFGYILLQIS